jgi:hypothetical protein
MRQIMPHRNNIGAPSFKCKIFLSECIEMHKSATFLPQPRKSGIERGSKFLMLNNGLNILQKFIACISQLTEHG